MLGVIDAADPFTAAMNLALVSVLGLSVAALSVTAAVELARSIRQAARAREQARLAHRALVRAAWDRHVAAALAVVAEPAHGFCGDGMADALARITSEGSGRG